MDNNIQHSTLNTQIISTLCFFDMFDYPLTLFEIWKYFYQYPVFSTQYSVSSIQYPVSIYKIRYALENNEGLKKIISSKDGFYFLKSRDEIVQRRLNCYNAAQPRWDKLKKVCKWLQVVPFLKMIAACNTFSINDVLPKNDIDVFVIAKYGRIWTTRFLVTIITWLLGEWRHGKKIAGKICLSFFITDRALNLRKIAQRPYDIYLTYWIPLVFPIYETGIARNFFEENKWIKEYLPNCINFEGVPKRIIEPNLTAQAGKFLQLKRKILEFILKSKIGDLLESFLKKIQINFMKKIKSVERMDSDIVISDEMLKFHEVDRRKIYREKFERCVASKSC